MAHGVNGRLKLIHPVRAPLHAEAIGLVGVLHVLPEFPVTAGGPERTVPGPPLPVIAYKSAVPKSVPVLLGDCLIDLVLVDHGIHDLAVNATGMGQISDGSIKIFIFRRQHQLTSGLLLHRCHIMFCLFVGTAAQNHLHRTFEVCGSQIFLCKLDDVPALLPGKLIISPSMSEQIQAAAVLYMNRVPVAFLHLKAVADSEINDIGIKDLLHLLFGKGHGASPHGCLSVRNCHLPVIKKGTGKMVFLPFCQRPALYCHSVIVSVSSAVISASFRPEKRSPPFRPASGMRCSPGQTQWVPALPGRSSRFHPGSFHLRRH